jgi:hypothetical protein
MRISGTWSITILSLPGQDEYKVTTLQNEAHSAGKIQPSKGENAGSAGPM